ncbi:3-phenylpropionate/trans-cinnamate dioxygenase ferredoxin reductase subunit [Tessaracoccus bendigoensis DSM 12906]|uniref:3-phenylpropionate/trans-cinnamate dioxygenase ferredoxin reductase subunit n=1 Tax=Tessaracoccus bendigoensis DSM 12906 TaxID=1123357 RepID=A0A1M6BI63_9ACTN|nr:FAD-dependent oxidoreductase [Tessaracoccus bendigoensis]SHI48173.1 3-phenylpropionate/trans-cinnamate dioxygenase ferredoxin reductase subunit [Tessaracoccus bendigoensis DSM 12906]
MSTYVVIGGGLAGAKSVEELRDLDGEARIVLVGGEAHLPYERPPLSKEYLVGGKALEEFTPLAAGWFADNEVEARLGIFATDVDAAGRLVHLSDGSSLAYDGLILATGSRPRTLNLPGVGRSGVQTLRTLEDADQLRAVLTAGGPLVVYGGGWIGLEVAAVARTMGVPVTVVVREDRVLRQLGDEVAPRFVAMHREHGVEFAFNSTIASIDGDGERGAVKSVTLGDGRRVEAAAVLIAVGAEPRVELAQAAGLEVEGGVLVDDSLRSSDPAIFAVGDIANAENRWVGGRIRVEHWATALSQPAIAARGVVGDEAHYDLPPFFYTDQYDLGMEFRGVIPDGATLVTRDTDEGYISFWLRGDGVPRAVMNVNVWDQGDAIDALLKAGRPADAAKLRDPGVPLDAVAV